MAARRFDIERMRGSIFDRMAEGIEESAAVIVCMSRSYKESPNCRHDRPPPLVWRRLMLARVRPWLRRGRVRPIYA